MARGPIAEQIAGLTWFLTVVGLVVYVLVLVLFVVPMWRRRRAAADEPDPHAGESVPAATANRWIVLGGVVLPVFVLPVTLGVSVATMRNMPFDAPSDALVVDVTGHRWWWSVHYPDQDVTLANEIHIPVGRPVELRLASSDVIHSFWVPKLAGKIDALPDRVNTLVIEADEPGEYEGACAEFCGLNHAEHRILVVAQPPEDFAAWLDAQRRPAVMPVGLMAAAGQRALLGARCASCHTVRGTAAVGTDGPDLTHFGSRRTVTAALLEHTRENLARWVRDPRSTKEGTSMPPPTELDDAEVEAVIAYLESLE